MRKFDGKKIEKALNAIEECCLHCSVHSDDCELVRSENELKKAKVV